jgi:hypothetical protein
MKNQFHISAKTVKHMWPELLLVAGIIFIVLFIAAR